jgi:hypothetical protein
MSPQQAEYVQTMQQGVSNYLRPFYGSMQGYMTSAPQYYVGQGGYGGPGYGGGAAWGQSLTSPNGSSSGLTLTPNPAVPDTTNASPEEVSSGLQYFAQTPMYQISPYTQGLLGDYIDYTQQAIPGIQQNPYALNAEGTAFQNPVLQSTAGMFQDAYGYVRNPQFAYQGADIGVQGVDGSGMFDPAQGSTPGFVSPEAAIAAAKDYFNTISMPGLSAAAASMGAGRSGAELQLGEEAGTKLSLPISQLQMQLEQSARNEGAKNLTAADIANAQASAELGKAWGVNATQANIAAAQIAAQQNLQYNSLLNTALQNSQGLTAQMAPQIANWAGNIVNAGALYNLTAPEVISSLAQSGITASQMPEQYFAQNLANQQNMLLSLMGLNPMPGGGSQTSKENPGALKILHTLASDLQGWMSAAGGMGASTERVKEDISEPLDAASIVRDTLAVPVRTWRYKWDTPGRRRVGPILEQMPPYWRENSAMFDMVTAIGALLLTVQYLASRIEAHDRQAAGLPWPIQGE